MKIVYCIYDHTAKGGTERIIARKCNALADKYDQDIYIIDTNQSNRRSAYHFSEKISFYNLSVDYRKYRTFNLFLKLVSYPFLYLLHKIRLSRIIHKINPDIIISTFSYEASIIPQIKHRSVKILEFHHCRGYKTLELKNRNLSCIQKWILTRKEEKESKIISKYNCFVVLTEEDRYSWNDPDNCIVIPNMNSFTSDKIASLENKKALAVGRLTYQKGFDLLIEAWKLVSVKYPDWHLDIAGEGEEKEKLLEMIDKLSLKEQISILSFIPDIVDVFISHSLYILSSRHEGFGLTLIEAMECGVPCISFKCKSGPSDIILDGIDGLLVENGNIKELAGKIEFLILHSEMRKQMGMAAKKNVVRFSENIIMEKWINLFKSLIGEI